MSLKDNIHIAVRKTVLTKVPHVVVKINNELFVKMAAKYDGEHYEALTEYRRRNIIVRDEKGKKLDEFDISKPSKKTKKESKPINLETSNDTKDKSGEVLSSAGNGESKSTS